MTTRPAETFLRMRILLTGKTGQIGWELERELAGLGEVTATGRQELDLSQADQIRACVRRVRPDLIVNAAAYTAVDQAEKEPDLAMAINGAAPGIFAEEAQKSGAVMIHYSTDYVFNGEKNTGPYVEDDPPGPMSVYGQTKLAGELAIAKQEIPHLILRTSWIYGLRGKNFLQTILRLAKEREELRIVNDQTGSPTWCRSVATATRRIVARLSASSAGKNISSLKSVSGVYHLSCAGETSWHGFARAIVDSAKFDPPPRVVPIPTSEYPTPARRPRYSVLSNAKVQRVLEIELPNWKEALQQCLKNNTLS